MSILMLDAAMIDATIIMNAFMFFSFDSFQIFDRRKKCFSVHADFDESDPFFSFPQAAPTTRINKPRMPMRLECDSGRRNLFAPARLVIGMGRLPAPPALVARLGRPTARRLGCAPAWLFPGLTRRRIAVGRRCPEPGSWRRGRGEKKRAAWARNIFSRAMPGLF